VNLKQAFVWNVGSSCSDDKREIQAGSPCKNESIEAERCVGTGDSSDEVSVMEMERRACIVCLN